MKGFRSLFKLLLRDRRIDIADCRGCGPKRFVSARGRAKHLSLNRPSPLPHTNAKDRENDENRKKEKRRGSPKYDPPRGGVRPNDVVLFVLLGLMRGAFCSKVDNVFCRDRKKIHIPMPSNRYLVFSWSFHEWHALV
jgi:hypothetical protein